MRYGTRTHCKKRWTPQGERPVCPVKLGYEWGYLYVALCPFDGDVFAMFYNGLNKACFDHFLSALDSHIAKGKQKGKTLLVGDGATAHTSQDWQERSRFQWHRQPTACPEVNPVERFFEEIRKHTAKVFGTLEEIEQKITELVNMFIGNPKKVISLTLYPYINT